MTFDFATAYGNIWTFAPSISVLRVQQASPVPQLAARIIHPYGTGTHKTIMEMARIPGVPGIYAQAG